jgi:hypothetical protein
MKISGAQKTNTAIIEPATTGARIILGIGYGPPLSLPQTQVDYWLARFYIYLAWGQIRITQFRSLYDSNTVS